MTQQPCVLILGSSGMLGNAVVRYFVSRQVYSVVSASRSSSALIENTDVRHIDLNEYDSIFDFSNLSKLVDDVKPDFILNCIGVIKQRKEASFELLTLANAYFPHMLLRVCHSREIRLVHISTDCVFAGSRGMYRDFDTPDSIDDYGLSKAIGELNNDLSVTLRTSIVGHELASSYGLLDWFLSQKPKSTIQGYTKAVFSGLTTIELSRVIHDFVLNSHLSGIYNVSSDPISKYDLLAIAGCIYDHDVKIERSSQLVIDRSLDSSRFKDVTGYVSPSWQNQLLKLHHAYF